MLSNNEFKYFTMIIMMHMVIIHSNVKLLIRIIRGNLNFNFNNCRMMIMMTMMTINEEIVTNCLRICTIYVTTMIEITLTTAIKKKPFS